MFSRITRRTFNRLLGRSVVVAPIAGVALPSEMSKAKMAKAYAIIETATPEAGGYVNESSYFDEDWGTLYWGTNYPRLLQIKRAVDPTGLFTGHHLVGSEGQPS